MSSELIFGIHAIKSRLKVHQSSVKELYLLKGKERAPKLQQIEAMGQKKQIKATLLSRQDFQKILHKHQLTEEVVHQNVLAYCESSIHVYQQADLLEVLKWDKPLFILVLDNVQDPHNMGACIRSAEAAGVDCIIFPKDKSASINATVEKVACGAVSHVKLFAVTNLSRALGVLKDRGVWVTGLAGEAQQLLYDIDLTTSCALVLGAEGGGLRFGTRKMCDYLAKLPMSGEVSSLNVSVAAGVSLYEVVRQRQLSV